MPSTLTKTDYLNSLGGNAAGYGPSRDHTDESIGTTVQTALPRSTGKLLDNGHPELLDAEGGIPNLHEGGVPGQVFTVDQLPDPAVAQMFSLPPQPFPAHLIVEGDEAETHPQGKDVLDILTAEMRNKIQPGHLGFDGKVKPGNSHAALAANTGPDKSAYSA